MRTTLDLPEALLKQALQDMVRKSVSAALSTGDIRNPGPVSSPGERTMFKSAR